MLAYFGRWHGPQARSPCGADLARADDGSFHYLAADPSLRAQTQNVNVTMGQATYVGKVLQVDQTWESPFKLIYPGSVVIDPATGQWRMYYELMKSETERFVAMATSTDGVHWTKPGLEHHRHEIHDRPAQQLRQQHFVAMDRTVPACSSTPMPPPTSGIA